MRKLGSCDRKGVRDLCYRVFDFKITGALVVKKFRV